MRKLSSLRLTAPPLWLSLLFVANHGSSAVLPVYNVSGAGASTSQAYNLASGLGIPAGGLSLANGDVSFLDPANFISLPMAELTNLAARSNVLAGSSNKYPAIPLSVQSLDLTALSNLVVLDDASASNLTANALSAAGLTPQFGALSVTHTTISLSYSNENNLQVSNSYSLDTKVTYQFTETGGYPLVGPGAQVQAAFGPGSGHTCTRLFYAARQLQPGPSVTLLSQTEAASRFAARYPGLDAQFTPQLLYYCPPLALGSVTQIIPHYLGAGTVTVTNPSTGTTSTFSLRSTLIPATDDPAFVPVPVLSAAASQGTQVVASVTVTGGSPPYTYTWHASNPAVLSNTGPNVAYAPLAQVASFLVLRKNAAGLALSWLDPNQVLLLESTPTLAPSAWMPDTRAVTTSDGINSVSVNPNSTSMFFRLRYQARPATETVAVTVTDANGISVEASTALTVQPLGAIAPPGPHPRPGPFWGTESPFNTGGDISPDTDTFGWRAAMTAGPGGGIEAFFWSDQQAANLDFIRSDVDQGGGWADDRGVDTADIVLYCGHGSPDGLLFSPLPLNWYDHRLPRSWGHDQLEWLCFDACNVLQDKPGPNDSYFPPCVNRWGPAFDGLHCLLGFIDPARISFNYSHAFAGVFARNLLGSVTPPALPIVKAWFLAADTGDGISGITGTPAAMGPLLKTSVPNGDGGFIWLYISDFQDDYWGKGPVGPTIHADQISGFWYLSD